MLADKNSESYFELILEASLEEAITDSMLIKAVRSLSERQKEILYYRYVLDYSDTMIAKKYNLRNLDTTLENFEFERGKSIRWLTELEAPNWDSSIQVPWGELSAGDMMASWLAHDLLHIRQLVELRYHLTLTNSMPYQVEYAGKW